MTDDEVPEAEEKSLGEVVSALFGEMGRRMSSLGAAMQQQEPESISTNPVESGQANPTGGDHESTVVALLKEIRDLLRHIADQVGGG